jgi:DNA-binding response OmpR family regulator
VTLLLVATDASWLFDELVATLADSTTELQQVSDGHDLRKKVRDLGPDLVILDYQIGSMGGVASSLDLKLETDMGRIDPVPALLLCDRRADVFMARRARVDGWLVKPLQPLMVRRAVATLLAGERFEDDTDLPVSVVAPSAAVAQN